MIVIYYAVRGRGEPKLRGSSSAGAGILGPASDGP